MYVGHAGTEGSLIWKGFGSEVEVLVLEQHSTGRGKELVRAVGAVQAKSLIEQQRNGKSYGSGSEHPIRGSVRQDLDWEPAENRRI